MKKTAGSLLFFLCSVSFLYGQASKTFTPREMKEDLDSLTRYIEETHPNPYYRYPQKNFYSAASAATGRMQKPLSLMEFYLLVQSLIACLEDGHTDLKPPVAGYNKTDPFAFPYELKLAAAAPYITCTRAFLPAVGELPAGAVITHINRIPAKKIVDDIISLNTGETRAFRADFGANYLDFYLETLYKTKGRYKISYRYDHQAKEMIVKGIRQQALTERLKKYRDSLGKLPPPQQVFYSLQLQPGTRTAMIDFQGFENLGRFKVFIDSAFKVIKSEGIQNLVIDIRKNSGGDSDIGDEFLQYLAHGPFRQYDQVVEKHSRLLKERLRMHRTGKKWSREDSIFMATPDTVITERYGNIPFKNTPLRFTGKVYLLTGAYTFSSAADFAQCIKHYKLGTIIGEETGGQIISYGDIVTTHLPHTQLTLTISSKLYYNVGARQNDRGVVPDIKMPAGQAMKYVLQLIREKRN
jgi:hypothetical protein